MTAVDPATNSPIKACPREGTDEGGDPPCWAHLFDEQATAPHAASGPDGGPEPTRS
ncbi:MAG: hypothetical protein ABI658_10570 [Acidimicrobiales bacterium]